MNSQTPSPAATASYGCQDSNIWALITSDGNVAGMRVNGIGKLNLYPQLLGNYTSAGYYFVIDTTNDFKPLTL
jgi:hypothetical protein